MKSALFSFLIIGTSIPFIFSCSPTTLINVVSPSNHYDKKTNIAYGKYERQKLDIYIPNYLEEEHKNSTVIVFFHGGGWDSGNKNKYKFVASRLTLEGYTVVIPSYRIYPNVVFPTFIEDAALAIAWLKNNQNDYSINTDKVYVMGHSAGAHIASLLTADKRYLESAGISVSYIAGFIGLAGPYNFLPLTSDKLKKIFPKEIRTNSQPINFVDGTEVPYLLLHGTDDKTVWPQNSQTLAEKILSKNGNVTLQLYEGINHIGIISPFIPGFKNSTPTVQDIINFINSNNVKENLGPIETSQN